MSARPVDANVKLNQNTDSDSLTGAPNKEIFSSKFNKSKTDSKSATANSSRVIPSLAGRSALPSLLVMLDKVPSIGSLTETISR
jgi:hypothetical protein